MSEADQDRDAGEPPRQDPTTLRGQAEVQRGQPEDMPEERRAAGHEIADASARGVVYVAVGFFLVLFLVGGVVWGLLAYFRETMDEPLVTEMQTRGIVPPPPRLELAPERNRAAIESEARARLEGYAWSDREAGVARIPVEEAMRLIAEHGWPDPFRAEDVVPPREAVQERDIPRAGGAPEPLAPRRREAEP